jgi:parallel beta-helix repeat protein
VCFAASGLAFFVLTVAGSPKPAFAAPLAGGIVVSSADDSNISDGVITLREALLIARGGTGPTGLARTLSNQERGLLTGCTFAGSGGDWSITGGCGAGIADTIGFTLTAGAVIAPASALPPIDDTAATTLDGTGVAPSIDVSGAGMQHGLRVLSSGNTIRNVGVTGGAPSPYDDFYVSGNNNTFSGVWAWNAGGDGFYISGNGNTLDSSRVGVFLTIFNTCSTGSFLFKGNGRYGVDLAAGASGNTLSNNYIGCNASNAVFIGPSAGTGNVIGPGNIIGTNTARTANLGNGGSGVVLEGKSNTVRDNTLSFNFHGIYITGTGNLIGNNAILSNTHNGINLVLGAYGNMMGCLSMGCGTANPNQISGNGGYGVSLVGGDVSWNYVRSSDIGASAHYMTAGGNTSGGILISGGQFNQIGATGALTNTISGNLGDGVRVDGGAFASYVFFNTIISNSGDGVRLVGSTTNNTRIANNDIEQNHAAGVHLNGGYANEVGNFYSGTSRIALNLGDGVLVETGAHDSLITGTVIGAQGAGNTGNGVHIQGGAYHIQVTNNDIRSNGTAGISIHDAATHDIDVTANVIAGNMSNGVMLWNATHDNLLSGKNIVLGNGDRGIVVWSGAQRNRISGASVSFNDNNGIELSDVGTIDNRIAGTYIANNPLDGINERNGAGYNTWTQVSEYGNGGLGVDKDAPNSNENLITPPIPRITSAKKVNGNWQLSGNALPSLSNTQAVTVELYIAAPDPSGYGEGYTYIVSRPTDGAGNWGATLNLSGMGDSFCFTALETVNLAGGHAYSSEFSQHTCLTFVPMVSR